MKIFFIAFLALFLSGFFLCPKGLWASSNDYIYRQRINWVKLSDVSSKNLPEGGYRHPYASLTTDQVEAMLLSVKISKKYVLKKEVDTVDIFSTWEAHKYAPMIIEALAKATPEQAVNFSIIHKRPFFILRHDRLTMANVFVASDGLHFQFIKIFAQMTGDYESTAHMDKAIREAKSLRLTLAAQPGQILSYDSPMELIFDPAYDFVTQVKKEQSEEAVLEQQEIKGSDKKEKKPAAKDEVGAIHELPLPESSTSGGQGPADRLKQLEDLKRQKLITEQEYQNLRKKILSGL